MTFGSKMEAICFHFLFSLNNFCENTMNEFIAMSHKYPLIFGICFFLTIVSLTILLVYYSDPLEEAKTTQEELDYEDKSTK